MTRKLALCVCSWDECEYAWIRDFVVVFGAGQRGVVVGAASALLAQLQGLQVRATFAATLENRKPGA